MIDSGWFSCVLRPAIHTRREQCRKFPLQWSRLLKVATWDMHRTLGGPTGEIEYRPVYVSRCIESFFQER